jgi:adenylate/nucleoside-diphosphate kinase
MYMYMWVYIYIHACVVFTILVAGKLCGRYGCLHLSIGEAIRRVVAQFPHSELTHQLLAHLQVGQTVPEELCVLALDRILLDVQCTTRGFVLDGWPLTKSHVDLLTKHRIIPVVIVEMQVSDKEMLRRAELDRKSPTRTYPVHDSTSILLVRSANYRKHVESVREWYSTQHHNWQQVDGERSRWWVWEKTREVALTSARQIQHYLARITSGRAAALRGLCVTPAEFEACLGEFSHYCPVNLAQNELVDCSHELSLQYSAEFRGQYYKMSGKAELEAFLHDPEQYVSPATPHPLPPPDLLPTRRSQSEVKAMFPKSFEIQGFCPVTYVDGKRRYECLVAGNPGFAAEYKKKLYCFASETHLDKFTRRPDKYEVNSLPAKLPPPRQPVAVTSLPMLGYLEQSAAISVINALSAVGAQKPKYPFLSSTKSALIYFAYHLKAYNPKSSDYVRNKYKKKLAYFEEKCSLISYLSSSMSSGYCEPCTRPIDFDHKISRFLGLKQCT